MVSRLRKNVPTLFDIFAEVGSRSNDGSSDGFILWKYPEDYNNPDYLSSISKFTFPGGISNEPNEAVQLFSFVKTDETGTHTFGYCRHTPKSNTCLCVVTAFPWPNFFYRFLNHIADVMNNKAASEMESFLDRTYHQEVPRPGDTFTVESSLGKNKLELQCPDHTKLPTIQHNRHLMEYYNAVEIKHMIAVYASMLRERRLIFTSHKLSQLSSCVIAANALIYPMGWQHIFIPVLPARMTDYLSAPMPFLVGISKSLWEVALNTVPMNEVVVLDIDNKTLMSPFNDYDDLPKSCSEVLKHELRTSNHMLGDGLARSFLRATVMLLGQYRRGLHTADDGKITFDFDRFLAEQPPKCRPFLMEMRKTQIFHMFFEERVQLVNDGTTADDEFELECRNFEPKQRKRDVANQVDIKEVYSSVRDGVKGVAKNITGIAIQGSDVVSKQLLDSRKNITKSIPKSIAMPNWTPKGIRHGSRTKERPVSEFTAIRDHGPGFIDEIGEQAMENGLSIPLRGLLDDPEVREKLNERSSILRQYDALDDQSISAGQLSISARRSSSLTDVFDIPTQDSASQLTVPQSFHTCHSATQLEYLTNSRNGQQRKVQNHINQSSPFPSNRSDTADLIDLKPGWSPKLATMSDLIFDPLVRIEETTICQPQSSMPHATPVHPSNIDILESLFMPSSAINKPSTPAELNNEISMGNNLVPPTLETVTKRNSLPPAGEERQSVADLRTKWETFE